MTEDVYKKFFDLHVSCLPKHDTESKLYKAIGSHENIKSMRIVQRQFFSYAVVSFHSYEDG